MTVATKKEWYLEYEITMNRAGLLGDVSSLLGMMGISCLLYTSPSPRDPKTSRMPSSA